MLSVSNGFQVLGRTATVFSVDDIGFRYKGIPEEYIVFGEITGDDEKLCFHEKTGELVTIKDGVVYKYSAEAFLEYCIDQGLDGMFMSDTDSSAPGLSENVRNKLNNYNMMMSSNINNIIVSFKNQDMMDKEKTLFRLPVLIRTILFSALSNDECMEIVEYIRSQNNYKADNLLRGMKRRAIDNYFNRERKLLDDGKSTYPWNFKQMREIYNFDDSGMSYQNAGVVYEYDAAENRVEESVASCSGMIRVVEKKMGIKFTDSSMNRVGDLNNIRMRG